MTDAYGVAWTADTTVTNADPLVIDYVWPGTAGAAQTAAQMTKALDAGLQLEGKTPNDFKTEFLAKVNADAKFNGKGIKDLNGGKVSFSQKNDFQNSWYQQAG